MKNINNMEDIMGILTAAWINIVMTVMVFGVFSILAQDMLVGTIVGGVFAVAVFVYTKNQLDELDS